MGGSLDRDEGFKGRGAEAVSDVIVIGTDSWSVCRGGRAHWSESNG